INALLISGGTISGNGTLTITSGQLLGLGGALVGNIDFGGVEGVLQVPSGLNIPGIISGSAGLVKSGWGAGTLSGMNTYTGATTVLSGQLILNTDILPNAPGALGNSNDPVVIAPGTTAAHLWCNTNATFERDLIVTGN